MKNELKGFQKIFEFTFMRQVTSKSYLLTTILIGLLCLAAPAAIIVLPEVISVEETEDVDGVIDEELARIDRVYVVDETQEEEFDLSFLQIAGEGSYADIEYIWCGSDLESADARASADENAMILLIQQAMGGYELNVLIPDESDYDHSDAWMLANYLETYGQGILNSKAGLDFRKTMELSIPVYGSISAAGEFDAEAGEIEGDDFEEIEDTENIFESEFFQEEIKSIVFMIITYLVIFLMYFMILFYGQGLANNVILEKSSKLMDTFLVSVRPSSMIFGKVMAVVCTSFLQLLLWILLVIGSFVGGTQLLMHLKPETDSMLVMIFSSLKGFSSLFSIPGLLLGIVVLLFGFMMYATMASICGALVDKAEDLSSSIGVFTIILVISFMVTLYGGVLNGSVSLWMNLVPFTSALVLPSTLLLGECSLWIGLAALAIMVVCTLILLVIAGRVYKLMVFYRGKRPSVKEIITMLCSGQ